GYNAATLNGSVRANGVRAKVSFQYGLTTAYGSSISAEPSPITGAITTPVSATLTGLPKGTEFHYRTVAETDNGTTVGADGPFTTLPDPPAAVTGNAGNVTQNGAQLTGAVNANGAPTKFFFEYGFTNAYGNRTEDKDAGSGTTLANVQETLAGLGAGLTYHF